MIDWAVETLLATFVVLCRIGGCLMLVPGFSSPRVPMRFRLFIALALSAAIAPIVAPPGKIVLAASELRLALLVVSELVFGVMLGLLCRFIFIALEVMGEVIAMAIGLANNLGAPIDGNEPMPTISALISLCAALLVLVLDLHWEIIRGLVSSYAAMPIGERLQFRVSVGELADAAAFAFAAGLKIAGPFLVFSIMVNFAFGLVNKMIPQIPVYFISMPFLITGGLWLLYALAKPMFQLFVVMLSLWIAKL